MPGMINFGAGIAAGGNALASFAGNMAENQMKMDMERQSITLSNQLAAEREHAARVETGAPEDVVAKKLSNVMTYRTINAQLKLSGHSNGLADFGINSPEDLQAKGVPPAVGGTAQRVPSGARAVLDAGAADRGATSAPDQGGTSPEAPGAAGGGVQNFGLDKKGRVVGLAATSLPPGWTQTMAEAYPAAYAEALKEWGKPMDTRPGGSRGHYEGGKYVVDYQQPASGAVANYDAATNSMRPIQGATAALAAAEAAKTEGLESVKDRHEMVDAYDPATETNQRITRAKALERLNQGMGLPPPRADNAQPNVGAQNDGSFKMPDGAVIPPAPQAAASPGGVQTGPSASDKATQENYAKVIGEWNASTEPAALAEGQIQVMAEALRAVRSGAWASTKAEIARHLIASGMDTQTVKDITKSDPAKAQELMKNNFGLALNQLSASRLGRITQNEIFAAQKQVANPDLEPEANLQIMAEGLGISRWQQSFAAGWNVARRMGYDPLTYQAAFVKANPVKKFMDAAKEEIGPLKGMPGATTFVEGKTYIDKDGNKALYRNGQFVEQP